MYVYPISMYTDVYILFKNAGLLPTILYTMYAVSCIIP